MISLSKCPNCGFTYEGVSLPSLLENSGQKELMTRLFNCMKAYHKYDGPFQYKSFLKEIESCSQDIKEQVIKKFIAEKKYIEYGLPYLRGWIQREDERVKNKREAEKLTGGVHPPEMEEE